MDTSSQKNPRILIFTTAYEPLTGGSELAIKGVVKRLSDIQFDIITPRYSKQHKRFEEHGNVRIHRVGSGSMISKWVFPITGCIKGNSLSKKNDYSAIHTWQASHAGGAAWNLRKWGNKTIPLILTLQEGKNLEEQSLFIKFFRKLILKSANHVTAISSYLVDYVHSVFPDKEVALIPNGVDVENFSQYFSEQAFVRLREDLGYPGLLRKMLLMSL
jgi:glycosyltransferase involved in cell wall biosynthesis